MRGEGNIEIKTPQFWNQLTDLDCKPKSTSLNLRQIINLLCAFSVEWE